MKNESGTLMKTCSVVCSKSKMALIVEIKTLLWQHLRIQFLALNTSDSIYIVDVGRRAAIDGLRCDHICWLTKRSDTFFCLALMSAPKSTKVGLVSITVYMFIHVSFSNSYDCRMVEASEMHIFHTCCKIFRRIRATNSVTVLSNEV